MRYPKQEANHQLCKIEVYSWTRNLRGNGPLCQVVDIGTGDTVILSGPFGKSIGGKHFRESICYCATHSSGWSSEWQSAEYQDNILLALFC